MRIDKFLSIVNLVKRRSVAQDMCINQIVYLNGSIAKPGKEVKVGDIINLVFLEKQKKVKILEIPNTKTVSKKDAIKYIEEIP